MSVGGDIFQIRLLCNLQIPSLCIYFEYLAADFHPAGKCYFTCDFSRHVRRDIVHIRRNGNHILSGNAINRILSFGAESGTVVQHIGRTERQRAIAICILAPTDAGGTIASCSCNMTSRDGDIAAVSKIRGIRCTANACTVISAGGCYRTTVDYHHSAAKIANISIWIIICSANTGSSRRVSKGNIQ